MEYLKNNELTAIDDFPLKMTNELWSFINKSKKYPDEVQLKNIIGKIRTNFFQINRNMTRSKFIKEILEVIPQIEIVILEKSDVKMINILFLASNPKNTDPLRLDEEMRTLDLVVRSSDLRDKINMEQQWAVRLSDLQEHFLRYRPNIVHFSGHGSEDSKIILEDDYGESIPVPPEALAKLFKIFKDEIKVVVLNACFSENQAKSIAEHIQYVVGMADTILNKTAIIFSAAFYRAIGYGQTIEIAFDLALNQIDLESANGSDIPVLIS